ncbi:MAG: BamA/TamA family outer membrane protein [bacterium]|nr:BamA/TamA family outer membrane protein [bacterium]
MRRPLLTGLYILLSTLLLATASVAAEAKEYKEVSVTPHRQPYFSVLYTKDHIAVRLPESAQSQKFDRRDLTVTSGNVAIKGKPLFDNSGVHIGDSILSYDRITDLQIIDSSEAVIIQFMTSASSTDPVAQKRRGNRFSAAEVITIAGGEFVRGMVFSVTGDIRVDGEVNKDVVSLFGTVTIGQAAVIRGDVATIGGGISVERKASVYGNTYNGTEEKVFRRHRLNRGLTEFSYQPFFVFNRVDGANPNLSARFQDTDSMLPSIWASAGYAFASSSWRVKGGIEQTIEKKHGITIGLEGHRDLLSDDDWLLSDRENTVYALTVTEDFKDYYEEIGGSIYAKARPIKNTMVTLGFRSGETNWLPANRNLWSVFGGDKRFSENFTTVPTELLTEGAAAIDTGKIASVYGSLGFDNRNNDPFSASAWAFTLSGEISSPDFSSDYDFSRFVASLRRYQMISHYSILLLRGMIGGSEGDIPIHRTFYLGGLGTLHGYRHKELMGSRFWMINSELRYTFPRTDVAVSVLWDMGQIGYHGPNDENIEVRHSIGGALYFGDDVRVSVARRLDSVTDRNPRIFVRLEHVF